MSRFTRTFSLECGTGTVAPSGAVYVSEASPSVNKRVFTLSITANSVDEVERLCAKLYVRLGDYLYED